MPDPGTTSRARQTRALKAEALRLGFDACGVSRAEPLDDEARRLEEWLAHGRHASMAWMERHFDLRIDPRKLVPGALSVISVLHGYAPETAPAPDPAIGRISRYAWGDDYHEVVRERLARLFDWLVRETGEISGRGFVDSAPLMDKVWASRSGLGWQGKHTNLIHPAKGSWFFIGSLVVDVDLEPDAALTDHCGRCTRCIDACPTGAITAPYELDAGRCISYLTIEHRGADIPETLTDGIGNWIFGCDVCQEVCPWNKFSRPSREPRYAARPGVTDTRLDDWEEVDLDTWRALFRHSAVKRSKFDGFRRNVRVAVRNRVATDRSDPGDPG